MDDEDTTFEEPQPEPVEPVAAGSVWRGWGWPKELAAAKPGDTYLDEATGQTHTL